MARPHWVGGVICECRNARVFAHQATKEKGLPPQPGNCKNWEGQHPVSSGLIPTRAARENQSPARGSEGLAHKHSAVSSQGWAEVPVSDENPGPGVVQLPAESASTGVVLLSATMGGGNRQLQSHPLNSGINEVLSGEPSYPYEFNNNNKEK